ncbi:MAG: CsgG/HfaB family protein [Gemmatimonadota bacterium]|nr:CsgG/HfaB family protein [Gemmatimonadota bacterium]MDH3478611.1 CsgG/HfaB family protein [Gemmatimonadota bacterium]MDH3569989.1 CsgG/HfaB family protein [Gemmatimonadota bacterium]MDH5550515.1 CsgG/HfaB family protein [Gemmatimonadota bacterium]
MRWRAGWTLAALLVVPGLVFAQDTRPGLAVVPFTDGGSYGQEKEDFEALTIGLQQMLTTELAANANLRIVDRSRIKQVMAEQDLGASGRVDAGTAAQIGKIVGAKYVVMGGFVDWFGDMRLDGSVVNVETSEIVKVQRARGDREGLFSLVVELADGLTKGLSLPPLSRQALQERERRSEQIPHEAVRLYTRAVFYADRGDNERARELFSEITREFPEYTEASEALRQLRSRS